MATILTNNFNLEKRGLGTIQNARILVGTELDGSVYLMLADAGGRVWANIGLTAAEASAFGNQLLVAAVNTEFAAETALTSMH